jgi:peroxiredoxin Q/BCP
LRQDYSEFASRNAEVLVVGPDDPEEFREYWRREDLPFVGLADPRHRVAKQYGQEVSLLKLGRLPAVIVLDAEGQIRYRHYATWMSDIPANAEVLAVLDRLTDQASGH